MGTFFSGDQLCLIEKSSVGPENVSGAMANKSLLVLLSAQYTI